jgi:hypothetical protein
MCNLVSIHGSWSGKSVEAHTWNTSSRLPFQCMPFMGCSKSSDEEDEVTLHPISSFPSTCQSSDPFHEKHFPRSRQTHGRSWYFSSKALDEYSTGNIPSTILHFRIVCLDPRPWTHDYRPTASKLVDHPPHILDVDVMINVASCMHQ